METLAARYPNVRLPELSAASRCSLILNKDILCVTGEERMKSKPEITISILAPVGSALLGLSIGDKIEWPKPGGGNLKVRITEIIYQPERSGDYQL
ncbi:GreA2 [Desulforapulum autotrophicum HRM2]|uniref:GreA2 n=2 Tax=Desulforapulum autotrophicum TaxID=2296 RepID=C0QME5_DESAH|nr:GreA2 [Desulforapulum autotrophicum HRM2]